MPKFLMLSSLRGDEKETLSLNQLSRYARFPKQDLKKIYQGIDVPDTGLTTVSIPDLWAQPLRFQQALLIDSSRTQDKSKNGRDKKTVDTNEARDIWRGMLALYVLREQLNLSGALSLKRLFKRDGGPESASFLQVARILLPENLTGVNVGWESIHLLFWGNYVLGCTSPLTFFCPAAMMPNISIKSCGWFNNGVFSDPIRYLAGARLNILHGWLVAAKHSLQDFDRTQKTISDSFRCRELCTEISRFIEDVEAASVFSPPVAVGLTYDPASDLSGPVQDCLKQSPEVIREGLKAQTAKSSFLLRGNAGARPTLIISDTFLNLPQFNEGTAEVVEGLPLSEALRSYRGDHNVLGNINLGAEGCAIYKAEEIFTESIYYATGAGLFSGAFDYEGTHKLRISQGGDSITPILPLSIDFAGHFTPEYLAKNVAFSGDSQKLTVTLKIKLNSNGVGGELEIPISKTYAGNSIRDGIVPEVKIWPEYDATTLGRWGAWFTFYDDLAVPSRKLLVYPPPSKTTSDEENASLRQGSTQIVHSLDDSKKIVIHQTKSFPSMLFCSVDGEAVGVLLPKATRRSEHHSVAAWRVGIDFGTTGTSVFYQHGQHSQLGGPEPLPLKPHILSVSKPLATESYSFFLPTSTENTDGLLSVFRDFQKVALPASAEIGGEPDNKAGQIRRANVGDQRANTKLQVRPFHDGHISFVQRSEPTDYTGGIYADMKWGTTAEIARGKAFLQQLCLLTALQACVAGAQKVDWIFSYPLSFSKERVDMFEKTWEDSVSFARRLSGYAPETATKPSYFNESVCAAEYARTNMQAEVVGGALILDIGGGSSDISYWRSVGQDKSTPILNASVKLGGRDIFQRVLLNGNKGLLEQLVDRDQNSAIEIVPSDPESINFSKIDAFFKRNSGEAMESILSNLHTVYSSPSETVVRPFCKLLMLGLQGLFYYTGLLIRHSADNSKVRGTPLTETLPNVFVCGNGSKIFTWLGGGSFTPDAERRLLHAYLKGAGSGFTLKEGARITLSAHPKWEAAWGMLLATEHKPFGEQQLVSGEAFSYLAKEYTPMDVVPFGELKGGSFTLESELPGLTAALEAIGYAPLSAQIKEAVREQVGYELVKIGGRRAKTLGSTQEKFEDERPLFIMELEALIRIATQDWKDGKDPWWA